MILVALVAFSAIFDIDIVLGAFAAGFVLRFISPEEDESHIAKLEGIGFGFLIPLFFIVSGSKIDLSAIAADPATARTLYCSFSFDSRCSHCAFTFARKGAQNLHSS